MKKVNEDIEEEEEEEDPGAVGFVEFLKDILLFGVDAIQWTTILITNTFFNLNEFETSLVKLSDGKGNLKNLVCGAFVDFLSFLDYLRSLFSSQKLEDEAAAAKKAKDRFDSCKDILKWIGEGATEILRSLMLAFLNPLKMLGTIFIKALVFAGSLVGQSVASLEKIMEDTSIAPTSRAIGKNTLREGIRLIFFASGSMGVVQNALIEPSVKKLADLMKNIAKKLGSALGGWFETLLTKAKALGTFLTTLWTKMTQTAVWNMTNTLASTALVALGNIEDAVSTALTWLQTVIGKLGKYLLNLIAAIIGPAAGIIWDWLKIVMEPFSQSPGFPISEKSMGKIHELVMESKVVPKKEKERLNFAAKKIQEFKTQFKKESDKVVKSALKGNLFQQMKMVWTISGEAASWSVDGMPDIPSQETRVLLQKYFRIDINTPLFERTPVFADYNLAMIHAISVPVEPEFNDLFFDLIDQEVLKQGKETVKKISGNSRIIGGETGDPEAGMTTEARTAARKKLEEEKKSSTANNTELSVMSSSRNNHTVMKINPKLVDENNNNLANETGNSMVDYDMGKFIAAMTNKPNYMYSDIEKLAKKIHKPEAMNRTRLFWNAGIAAVMTGLVAFILYLKQKDRIADFEDRMQLHSRNYWLIGGMSSEKTLIRNMFDAYNTDLSNKFKLSGWKVRPKTGFHEKIIEEYILTPPAESEDVMRQGFSYLTEDSVTDRKFHILHNLKTTELASTIKGVLEWASIEWHDKYAGKSIDELQKNRYFGNFIKKKRGNSWLGAPFRFIWGDTTEDMLNLINASVKEQIIDWDTYMTIFQSDGLTKSVSSIFNTIGGVGGYVNSFLGPVGPSSSLSSYLPEGLTVGLLQTGFVTVWFYLGIFSMSFNLTAGLLALANKEEPFGYVAKSFGIAMFKVVSIWIAAPIAASGLLASASLFLLSLPASFAFNSIMGYIEHGGPQGIFIKNLQAAKDLLFSIFSMHREIDRKKKETEQEDIQDDMQEIMRRTKNLTMLKVLLRSRPDGELMSSSTDMSIEPPPRNSGRTVLINNQSFTLVPNNPNSRRNTNPYYGQQQQQQQITYRRGFQAENY